MPPFRPAAYVPLSARQGGETLVSRFRFLAVVLLLCFPLARLFDTPYDRRVWWGLGAALIALGYAAAVHRACWRESCPGWIGYATSVLDVTFVSLVLAGYAASDRPEAAAHSAVVYALYMLAILATSLRYDVRICVVAGTVAVLQYLAILLAVELRWSPAPGWHPPMAAGAVDWKTSLAKIVLLGIASLLAAASVVRARELRRHAIHDRLTGLHNRGLFEERLAEEAARAGRSGEPLTVALLDIDRFKEFNDTHGHRAGDEALRALGRLLDASFRESDLVARYGGEEFVVLLPGTGGAQGLARAEELRTAFAGSGVRLPPEDEPARLTLSAGVATWPEDGASIDEVVAVADRRLYQAKGEGRNRAVGAGPALDRIVQHG